PGREDDAAAAPMWRPEPVRSPLDVVEEEEHSVVRERRPVVDRGDVGQVDLPEEPELASLPGGPGDAGRQVRRAAEARAPLPAQGQAQADLDHAAYVGGALLE